MIYQLSFVKVFKYWWRKIQEICNPSLFLLTGCGLIHYCVLPISDSENKTKKIFVQHFNLWSTSTVHPRLSFCWSRLSSLLSSVLLLDIWTWDDLVLSSDDLDRLAYLDYQKLGRGSLITHHHNNSTGPCCTSGCTDTDPHVLWHRFYSLASATHLHVCLNSVPVRANSARPPEECNYDDDCCLSQRF